MFNGGDIGEILGVEETLGTTEDEEDLEFVSDWTGNHTARIIEWISELTLEGQESTELPAVESGGTSVEGPTVPLPLTRGGRYWF